MGLTSTNGYLIARCIYSIIGAAGSRAAINRKSVTIEGFHPWS